MSVTTDASSPASVTATGRPASIVTASFTPPANTMLCALCAVGWNASALAAVTVSDSGSHAWTKKSEIGTNSVNGGLASIWTIPVMSTSPGAITVTMAITGWASSGGGVSLDLLVLNGAATSQAGAATGSGQDTVGSTNAAVSVTTTAVGSRVYGVTDISGGAATWTAASGTGQDRQFNDTTDGATIADWISIPSTGTVTPGAASYGGTLSVVDSWNTAALEILAAPVSIPNRQLIIAQAINRSNFF